MNEELSSPGPRAVCPNAWDSCQPRLTQPPRLTGPPKAPARPRSALYPKRGVAIPTQSSPSISFNFPRHDQETIIRLERLTPSILWAEPGLRVYYGRHRALLFKPAATLLRDVLLHAKTQRPPQIALDSTKAVASPLHPSLVPQSPLYAQSAFPASSWNTTPKPSGGGGSRIKRK